MSKVVVGADSLDGYLTEKDLAYLDRMDGLYARAMDSFKILAAGGFSSALANEEKKVIEIYNEMGHVMQEICKEAPGIKVYSFETEEQSHAEASRVIAKLRDIKTGIRIRILHARASEMLFRLAYNRNHSENKTILW